MGRITQHTDPPHVTIKMSLLFLFLLLQSRYLVVAQGHGSNCGASCVSSCGTKWERQGNRCYYFGKGKLSWNEAKKWCQQNGQLASVTDEQGYNFINSKSAHQVWIGGISEPGNETWVWTDCSPWGFTRWASGEPKPEAPDGPDKEKCAAQNAHMHDKKWAVEPCTDEKRFVCSTTVCSDNVPAIQDEPECSSDDCALTCDPGWEKFSDKCYFWSKESLFWSEAELKCQSLGGHLASVTSNNTHDYLHLHEKTPGGIWIGGTDQSEEGNWTWTDCSPWNFTRWGVRQDHQQPDDSQFMDGHGQDCLLFHSKKATNDDNVDWNDAACNLKKGKFICSKPLCQAGTSNISTVGAAGIASVIVVLILVCAAAIAFLLYRRSKKTKAEEHIEEVDENPVYDMYYFADGDRVDYGNVEAKDENELYGT